ncbi:hypothetical protein HOQ99_gp02 [Klebsiella phage phiBO1E]|uniref:Uncharacterized protein n=1 Tax=Klebsiella phage phiBO1E TaxID=1555207 RepID=A0A1U8VC11_9CAUD|nr:hypothetical protein HOQ99_gp02 [Klebsiella phage phiBO1E]AIT13571.1 hypothetical protein BO1E_0002 [Klebsiella phage phiBO1E]
MANSTANVFKLTAAASIRKALSGVVEAKRNITISALFHGLISSNVSWATDMQRSDAADFDMVLRTLLPIKFNKDSGKYEFNAKKCYTSAEKLGIELDTMRLDYKQADKQGREVIVASFYSSCMALYAAEAEQVKNDALDADAVRLQALGRVKNAIKKAKETGVSDADLVSMLVSQGVDVRAVLDATLKVAA